MNEELQTTLNDALVSVIESAASAKEFILAETPEVIEQLLMWKMIDSLVTTLFGIALLVSFWFVAKKTIAEYQKDFIEQNAFWAVGGVVYMGCSGILGFMCTFSLTWLKILIAPKLYLLEYATELMK